MKRLRRLGFALLLMTPAFTANAQSWEMQVIDVGLVRMFYSGFFAFESKDAPFAQCTNVPTMMWLDGLTNDSERKILIATLLTAKTTNKQVMVYYEVDVDGYCRYRAIDLL